MEKILKTTRTKFVSIIIMVIIFVVSLSWGMLQFYNNREIASVADTAEIHVPSGENEAYAEYIEAEKEYEAHFVTLASSIKQQESDRVTKALAVTAVIVIILGVIISIIVSRWLMKPVRDAYVSQERFIQDAAHELRNPLAAMSAALQQAPEKTTKNSTFIVFKRQTKRLINITEDLLYLERQSNNELAEINISELLEDVVEEILPLARSKNIHIKIKHNDDIVKYMSSVDYVRLVKNIVQNAVKYSINNEKVFITQKLEKNNIVLTVKDRGIGIPKKDIDRIGNRFFRASNTGEIQGTGLGIAIVTKILNSYGGSLNIDSKPGNGTEVTVKLPS